MPKPTKSPTPGERLVMPPELKTALAANPEAARNFDGFPPSSKKIILGWIASAKRAAETVRQAEKDLKANHYRQ
jgi:uncharacterized protein YdeI (YjbR/CyaY-like superfamily)